MNEYEKELVQAVRMTAAELCEIRSELKSGLEWFKSHANLATKQDLAETEKRILDAIASVSRDDPKIAQGLAEATAKLKAHTDALEAGVNAAKSAT